MLAIVIIIVVAASEITSLTDLQRENWGDPGDKQRPDGNNIVVTQLTNDVFHIERSMH